MPGSELRTFAQESPLQFEHRQSLDALTPYAVIAGDLDGDGYLDLVSAGTVPPTGRDPGRETVSVFFQRASGRFPEVADFEYAHPGPGAGGGAWTLAADDLDGDGDLDVACSQTADKFAVYTHVGPGDFTTHARLVLGGPGITPRPAVALAADVDGDGDLDLVAANGAGDTLSVFRQQAPGVFAPPQHLATGVQPVALAAADVDGDTAIDLVAANGESDSVTLFLRDASGEFVSRELEDDAMKGPASVAVADVDGDSDQDLVVANSKSDTIILFLQDASGAFLSREFDDEAMRGPADVAVADLDGDGDLDLVAANSDSDNLTLFVQDTRGEFPPRTLRDDSMERPAAVTAADLDGDGDLDLVTANEWSGTLSIFLQTSPAEFLPRPGRPVGSDGSLHGPGAVAAADLDSDGDLDLVVANKWSDTLSILLQTSPAEFLPHPRGPLGGDASLLDRPRSVVVADIDGDADLDIVSANVLSENVTIFFGGR